LADAASKGLLKLIAPAIVTTAFAMPLILRMCILNTGPAKVVPNTNLYFTWAERHGVLGVTLVL
jgi:hypothetical protein